MITINGNSIREINAALLTLQQGTTIYNNSTSKISGSGNASSSTVSLTEIYSLIGANTKNIASDEKRILGLESTIGELNTTVGNLSSQVEINTNAISVLNDNFTYWSSYLPYKFYSADDTINLTNGYGNTQTINLDDWLNKYLPLTGGTLTGSLTVNADMNINGNIYQNGSAYETHAEQVYTKDNLIILRDGAVSGMSSGEYAGFEALKYDGTNNGYLVFDNSGTAYVGDEGSLQPLATRDAAASMTDGNVVYWNAANSSLKTTSVAPGRTLGTLSIETTNSYSSNYIGTVNFSGQDENKYIYQPDQSVNIASSPTFVKVTAALEGNATSATTASKVANSLTIGKTVSLSTTYNGSATASVYSPGQLLETTSSPTFNTVTAALSGNATSANKVNSSLTIGQSVSSSTTYNGSAAASVYSPGQLLETTSSPTFTGIYGNLLSTAPQLAASVESNAITIAINNNSVITTNPITPYSAINHAIDFAWYNTHWQIGNIRDGSSGTSGFGVTYGNSNLRARWTADGNYNYGGFYSTGHTSITDNTDVTLTSAGAEPLTITDGTYSMGIATNEIQARYGTATSGLYLNALGGNLNIHESTAAVTVWNTSHAIMNETESTLNIGFNGYTMPYEFSVKGIIVGGEFARNQAAPAFIFDKNGTHYAGIGSRQSSDNNIVYFSAWDRPNSVWKSGYTFGYQWLFDGTYLQSNGHIYSSFARSGDSPVYTNSAIIAGTTTDNHIDFCGNQIQCWGANETTGVWLDLNANSGPVLVSGYVNMFNGFSGTQTAVSYTVNSYQDRIRATIYADSYHNPSGTTTYPAILIDKAGAGVAGIGNMSGISEQVDFKLLTSNTDYTALNSENNFLKWHFNGSVISGSTVSNCWSFIAGDTTGVHIAIGAQNEINCFNGSSTIGTGVGEAFPLFIQYRGGDLNLCKVASGYGGNVNCSGASALLIPTHSSTTVGAIWVA